MANEVADTLDKARALIEKPGSWGKGAHPKDSSCRCALEAIADAGDDLYSARDALMVAIGFSGISRWNDAPERTQAEVIQAFKEAAALARAGAL